MFATPLARRPNAIRAIGPIAPIATVITVIAFLVPSDKLLNFSRTFAANSTIGVTASRNACPTGISANFRSSTVFLNLFIDDSAVKPNSFSDNVESSSTEEFARSKTRDA